MRIDQGFLPILGCNPKVLVLGSMPSVRSLEDQQYYAHPQNAFWWIMSELFGFDPLESYESRTSRLTGNSVAVWDVVQSCHRQGSLDSAINQSSVQANDFLTLLNDYSTIRLIIFNGQAAQKLFKKNVILNNYSGDFLVMPSTSPANAATSRKSKLDSWQVLKSYI